MKTWLITDTHFFHDRLTETCGRPANHTELTVGNWQKMVTPEDLIIHLGDLSWGKNKQTAELVQSLPGRKVLVRGNHDSQSPSWYMSNGFDLCVDALLYRGAYLTHKPQPSLPKGAIVNVHGHLHNTPHHDYEPKEFHRLLALENVKYRPVLFEKFLADDLTPKIPKVEAIIEKFGAGSVYYRPQARSLQRTLNEAVVEVNKWPEWKRGHAADLDSAKRAVRELKWFDYIDHYQNMPCTSGERYRAEYIQVKGGGQYGYVKPFCNWGLGCAKCWKLWQDATDEIIRRTDIY